MKKIVVLLLLVCGLFAGCNLNKQSVVRIHIRANSNLEYDQEVKMDVKEDVIKYITPLLADCKDCNEVKVVLKSNLKNIEDVANNVLKEAGFRYVSSAKISNEYFPSRDYEGQTFPADYYDALIIELGEGVGDNWWCVAYPPLCFVGDEIDGGNIRYKSKLLELINKYLG